MKLKLTVEYAGEAFNGFQLQAGGQRTVQGELENALLVFCRSQAKEAGAAAPERIVLTASGRTDAGVHARGQVVSCDWPDAVPLDLYRLPVALNGITPHELQVLAVEAAPDDFGARLSPHIKCYSYRILKRLPAPTYAANRAWAVGPDLDLAAMILAAREFVGHHDFSAFRAADCQAQHAVRTIRAVELTRVGADEVLFQIVARSFLKHMVRIIVGTLVEIGRGRRAAGSVRELLSSGRREAAGQTAPAEGLCLEWVRYQ